MGKVKKDGYFLFFSIGFLIGGLVGVLALNCLISYRIDQYHEKINTLEAGIEYKDTRIKKLEETINKKRLIVKKIQVTLENEENKFTLEKKYNYIYN